MIDGYVYAVFHGKVVFGEDFPDSIQIKRGRLVVRFELPPKVIGKGLRGVTDQESYLMPRMVRRYALRTVKLFKCSRWMISRRIAETHIENLENVGLRRVLHVAEARVKESRLEFRLACAERIKYLRARELNAFIVYSQDAKTSRRLSVAQNALSCTMRNLADILLGLGAITETEHLARCNQSKRIMYGEGVV